MTEQQLVTLINNAMKEHKIYKFYQTRAWRELRSDIMCKHHNECYKCKQAGKITKATTVHHVLHIKDYPKYALSEYVVLDGKKILNLMPLCDACHWLEHPEKHERAIKKNKKDDKKITEERW